MRECRGTSDRPARREGAFGYRSGDGPPPLRQRVVSPPRLVGERRSLGHDVNDVVSFTHAVGDAAKDPISDGQVRFSIFAAPESVSETTLPVVWFGDRDRTVESPSVDVVALVRPPSEGGLETFGGLVGDFLQMVGEVAEFTADGGTGLLTGGRRILEDFFENPERPEDDEQPKR